MKAVISTIVVILATSQAFAHTKKVEAAAAKIKEESTRTIIKTIDNVEGNPCLPEGKSYLVELQVRQAAYDRIHNKIVYSWETAKTVNVDKSGAISEACGE
ncbi:hypothetical protein [Bdellovibrio sp. NC01]|uniref:hypothetical protein n=1 Tax=Bdellovibrio sp. NC01 TaxID=2220073 RepID=UPI00115BB034|nr:hypothetical protein [Bdellovibrio sp. NC01]